MESANPFLIDDLVVEKEELRCGAVVLTPTREIVLGKARLDALRNAPELSAVDRWLIQEVVERRESAKIVILRSVGEDGRRLWAVDPALNQADTEQLGYMLTRALLPLHRRMAAAGAVLFAHTDWGFKETEMMRIGVSRMLEFLERQPRAHAAVQAMDIWILKHLIFHFGMPFEHIVKSVLPEHLRLIQLRSVRVKQLVADLPCQAID